ncbi:MAG: outer membrane protein assembly factor BamA [Alistipes sp.]|nr:outer membrane protein assembly factor BamA [Candidatus Minthomonas equi]
MRYSRILIPLLSLMFCANTLLYAQNQGENDTKTPKPVTVDYSRARTYVIGGIRLDGIKYLNQNQIVSLTGLQVGQEITIPGEVASSIVKRIWNQRFFSSVSFEIDSLSAARDTAYFVLRLKERPRVSRWSYRGVKNSEQSDLKEKLSLRRGSELSDFILKSSVNAIKNYYKEKGFINAEVNVLQEKDTLVKNAIRVTFDIKRGPKVKIKTIDFVGNENVQDKKIIKYMEKTRDARLMNFFKSKKFNEKDYENDKRAMIDAFNEAGYRDARLIKDSIYYIKPNRMGIKFVFEEGKKYYFRNITWTGNSVYPAEYLNQVLTIKKGDIYDVVNMNKRLNGDPKKQFQDISSLYRDRGYLFFNVLPVEMTIAGDSVDVEMRVVEGKPATFNKIIINGNNVTNERVVRRQVFTKPGYLYNQSYLERSIREIASMGHFDPEVASDPSRGFSVIPNQASNTVDITYNVQEKPNSQFELSGGWGGNSFVGTVGISFNNFSIRRLFTKGAWKPVPLGDGQVLSLRFQTNGTYYSNASISFSEPWLFGKKPISLNISGYFSKQTNSYYYYQNPDQWFSVYGIAVGVGSRLKWPDNYFTLSHQFSWQTYSLKDWGYNFLFSTGKSHNLSYTVSLARNSTDQAIFPRQGSDFSVSLALTPPYSLFRASDTDYSKMTDAEHYKWIEYHKWSFKGAVYTKLVGDLVLMARAQFGYLGYYNKKWGYSPFEGFQVGGDGMSGYNTYGAEIISLRGYENYSLTPYNERGIYVGHVYDKFTVELRYPVLLQPQSTIFVLGFLEGGNCWEEMVDFNPFSIKRSAGVGVRIMLPMVGLLGIDWGYGFDPVGNKSEGGSNFHFVIGQQF